ncbi:unnamed protein product [Miscanthus lutarioriparius]|uniref:AP2/ERF domain-containing protein n=1 Tax=Miscanthus lutarioriparius TaxID=422564 RepID=A0A811NKS4_9POAL|nr:unnamed protein product [Miscanthus lutarioriparius]
MDIMGQLQQHATSSSSTSTSASSSSSEQNIKEVWSPSSSSSPPQPLKKRPAGRTKFRETRHPVFRGVRRRWVCEVRVPGNRGARLWLGTYLAAESAARAHDAAMLALLGRGAGAGAGRLNFPDSAWLLAVPPPSALSGRRGVPAPLRGSSRWVRRRRSDLGRVSSIVVVTAGHFLRLAGAGDGA